jgi:hypothetical protein
VLTEAITHVRLRLAGLLRRSVQVAEQGVSAMGSHFHKPSRDGRLAVSGNSKGLLHGSLKADRLGAALRILNKGSASNPRSDAASQGSPVVIGIMALQRVPFTYGEAMGAVVTAGETHVRHQIDN